MHGPRIGRTWCARRAGVCECLLAALLITAWGCRKEDQTAAPARAPAASSATAVNAVPSDPAHPVVRIETNLGTIAIQLDAENAPGTVNNFVNYVSEGFYTNTIFHYVDPGNMILGGGYAADHQLKPVSTAIRNEAHNGLKNVRGAVAMARNAAAIDSATSQFFIDLADAPQRDHRGENPDEYGYCVFGHVIEGLDVADRISQSPTHDFGGDLVQSPQPPVVIQSIRVAK